MQMEKNEITIHVSVQLVNISSLTHSVLLHF